MSAETEIKIDMLFAAVRSLVADGILPEHVPFETYEHSVASVERAIKAALLAQDN